MSQTPENSVMPCPKCKSQCRAGGSSRLDGLLQAWIECEALGCGYAVTLKMFHDRRVNTPEQMTAHNEKLWADVAAIHNTRASTPAPVGGDVTEKCKRCGGSDGWYVPAQGNLRGFWQKCQDCTAQQPAVAPTEQRTYGEKQLTLKDLEKFSERGVLLSPKAASDIVDHIRELTAQQPVRGLSDAALSRAACMTEAEIEEEVDAFVDIYANKETYTGEDLDSAIPTPEACKNDLISLIHKARGER